MTDMDEYGGFGEPGHLESLFDFDEVDTEGFQPEDLTSDDPFQTALPDDVVPEPMDATEFEAPLSEEPVVEGSVDDEQTDDEPELELDDPSAEFADPSMMAPEDPVVEEPAAPAEDPALQDDGVYGSSHEWNTDWFFQQTDGYCGPTSAAIIVNEYHDAGITDPEYMVNQAYELGLTQDISQGMYMSDVQTLLESSGVPCENVNSSMADLAQRLEDGYGVIAFVDSGEVWGDAADAGVEDNLPDHFLVVTEIDTNTGMVTLADPGSPTGNGTQMTIEQFENAWADSNYEMIATTTPDPELGAAVSDNQQLAIANVTGSDVIR